MVYCMECGKKMVGNKCAFCGWETDKKENTELKSAVGFINFTKSCTKCCCYIFIAYLVIVVIFGALP